jgi:L-seryl-tRNA(Ser) seleniumtransferase
VLPDEPDAASTLRAGAAVVTASGDKLLGGPQAGLVLGRAELVDRIRRHPLARAMRVDKLTLAALQATLRGPLPPVRMALERDVAGLGERAERIAAALAEAGLDAVAVATETAVGGGGAPGVRLASAAISVPERYAVALRMGEPAIVGRVERGRCLLDLRAVEPSDDAWVTAAVLAAAGMPPASSKVTPASAEVTSAEAPPATGARVPSAEVQPAEVLPTEVPPTEVPPAGAEVTPAAAPGRG